MDIANLNLPRRIKDLDEDGEIILEAPPETVNPLPENPASFKSFEDFYKARGGQKLTSHGVTEPNPENIVSLGGGLYQYHDPVTGKSYFTQGLQGQQGQGPQSQPSWLKQSKQLVEKVKEHYGEPSICTDCHVNEVYSHVTCNACNNKKYDGGPYWADSLGRRFPL